MVFNGGSIFSKVWLQFARARFYLDNICCEMLLGNCFKNGQSDKPFKIFQKVFTNPLEMERFFNGQLESILKGFGINDGFFSKLIVNDHWAFLSHRSS